MTNNISVELPVIKEPPTIIELPFINDPSITNLNVSIDNKLEKDNIIENINKISLHKLPTKEKIHNKLSQLKVEDKSIQTMILIEKCTQTPEIVKDLKENTFSNIKNIEENNLGSNTKSNSLRPLSKFTQTYEGLYENNNKIEKVHLKDSSNLHEKNLNVGNNKELINNENINSINLKQEEPQVFTPNITRLGSITAITGGIEHITSDTIMYVPNNNKIETIKEMDDIEMINKLLSSKEKPVWIPMDNFADDKLRQETDSINRSSINKLYNKPDKHLLENKPELENMYIKELFEQNLTPEVIGKEKFENVDLPSKENTYTKFKNKLTYNVLRGINSICNKTFAYLILIIMFLFGISNIEDKNDLIMFGGYLTIIINMGFFMMKIQNNISAKASKFKTLLKNNYKKIRWLKVKQRFVNKLKEKNVLNKKIKRVNQVLGTEEYTFPIYYEETRLVYELDTGSKFNIISNDYISEKIKDYKKFHTKDFNQNLFSVSGEQLDSEGVFHIPFFLPEFGEVMLKIIVIKNAKNIFLLGREFIQKTKACLFYDSKLKGVRLKYTKQTPSLKINEQISLGPREEKVIRGRIFNGGENKIYKVKNNNNCHIKFDALENTDDKILIKIQNKLNIPISHKLESATLIEHEKIQKQDPVLNFKIRKGKIKNKQTNEIIDIDNVIKNLIPTNLNRASETQEGITMANNPQENTLENSKKELNDNLIFEQHDNKAIKEDEFLKEDQGVDITKMMETEVLTVEEIENKLTSNNDYAKKRIAQKFYELQLYSKHSFDCGTLN